MLGFLMTDNQVLTGTDQLKLPTLLLLHEIRRSRKLTVGKKTCVLFNSKLLISRVSSSCLLSAQEKENKKRMIIWQKCTVVPAVRCVGVDRCILSLSYSSSNNYAKCYTIFEPLYMDIFLLSHVQHTTGWEKSHYFSGRGFCGEF